MINEAFEGNNPDQEISVRFMFENNEQTDKSDTRVEKFNFAVSGKTSELNKLIEKLKNSVSKILEIQ